MRRYLTSWFSMVLFGAAAAWPAASAAETPASAAEIARDVAARFAAAESLHVKWKMKTEIAAAVDDEYAGHFSIFPSDEFAAKGLKRFRRTETPLNLPAAPRARKACTYYFDGEISRSQCRNCDPPPGALAAENYHVVRGGEESGPVAEREQAVVYMECVGSPFYDGKHLDVWRRIRGRTRQTAVQFEAPWPFALVQALESGRYSIASPDVDVNGIRCVLLEWPGVDKIWLAHELGYAVVQREWNWGVDEPLMMRYVNSDFKQVVEGLWLPMTAVRQAFADPVRYPDSHGSLHFVNTCRVVEMHGNDLPDELFSITPIPGSTVMDNTKTTAFGRPIFISYVIGETPAQTEQNLERRVAERRRMSLAALKFWEWSAGDWFACGNLLLVLALAMYGWKKHKERRALRDPGRPQERR